MPEQSINHNLSLGAGNISMCSIVPRAIKHINCSLNLGENILVLVLTAQALNNCI